MGHRKSRLLLAAWLVVVATTTGEAACSFEPQGEGRVGAVIDARTFRLTDGREIRLAAIEPAPGQAKSTAQLAALLESRDIRLQGADDTPDRYGRQPALVFLDNADSPVQLDLLKQGYALFSGVMADRACAADLMQAEAGARKSRLGVWAAGTALKNAERPGDILPLVGQFVVVEGKVLSVRQAGATFYVNFGRRWTEGFAATISRRMITALETAGLAPKSLENRQVRVRGWVELRGGPRIDIFQVGQIELVGEK
ncbi:thermonuclease family protein [Bradyrhizobium prioriisuperbiae]|uniref:thermonuclease family protein n=1 Tax=Bradyrhizobium prioriisuperbiae TaxID=2854389 RepID=UPI0028EFC91E|nr:thermonuclease family protein [Bradyrhizobium prioritasuperba]